MTERGNLKNVAIIFLFFLVIAAAAKAKTIYVDADANSSGAGTNWDNAYNYLQDALADANTSAKPVEIRVAQGTYKPDEGAGVTDGNREATFQLINGVTLKGGYAGFGEADPNARDITSYETILSGDLKGNDREVPDPCDLLDDPCRADNSYHVVTGIATDATAILDGFTITRGNGNGSYGDRNDRGGGMYNHNSGSTTTLVNCTFTNNSARYGGGGIRNHGILTLNKCTFTDNFAFYRGGGTNNRLGSLILNGCTFAGNLAGEWGGGVYSEYTGPDDSMIFTDCTFIGNSAEWGGGIYGEGSGPMLIRCIFRSNCAKEYGGGMSSDTFPCFPTLIDCVFTGNSAGDSGGAMYNGWEVEFTLTNCTFTGNSAGLGGGICCYDYCENSVLTNCIFSGNLAVSAGGGLYSCHYCNATLTNCTFGGNSAAKGNAVGCDSSGQSYPSDLRLTNCILWDGGNEIWNNDASTIAVSYTDVQGGQAGIYDPCLAVIWGQGNINADPCFAEAGYWDSNGTPGYANDDYWVDGDYHLLTGSPCIDAGDNNSVPEDINDLDGDGNTTEPIPWDLDGNPRFVNGDSNGFVTVDMGAYEYRPPIYVDRDAPGPVHDGSSWATAYKYLQDALAVAVPGGEKIWVAQGIYTPDTNSSEPNGSGDRTATFQLINNVAIYGGYAGFGQPNANARDIGMYETILSGDLDGNDVPVANPSDLLTEPTRGENSLHVVTGSGTDSTAILDGFTITGGNANGSSNDSCGGGLCNESGSPRLISCTFSGNSATQGGGMHNVTSNPLLTQCTFIGNSAETNGGGIYNSHSGDGRALANCVFIDNSAGRNGGGMYNWIHSNPALSHCTFRGNSAVRDGGGMYSSAYSAPTLTNCAFEGNSAGEVGGGICSLDDICLMVTNCTFTGNSATYGGGLSKGDDIYCDKPNLVVTNCTFAGNIATLACGGIEASSALDCNQVISNSIVWGNRDASGADESAQICWYSGSVNSVNYNCIQGWTGNLGGIGNIGADPCFLKPGYWADANDPNIIVEPNDPNAVWIDGDYHLKSEGWCWDTELNPPRWGCDYVTSRCIDAGNPGSALCGEPISVPEDPNNIRGQNLRINMGAYGGTAEASMPPYDWALLADITNDGTVDFADYAHLAAIYTDQDDELPADFDRDRDVDLADLRLLAEDWLKQTSWYEP